MRKLSALLIASLIMAQAFYNLGVCVYWLANHHYIAAELCENRSKPALHCDGKCYLRKKMAHGAGDATPANSGPSKSFKKDFELFEFVVDQHSMIQIGNEPADCLIPAVPGCHTNPTADPVFHPPSC